MCAEGLVARYEPANPAAGIRILGESKAAARSAQWLPFFVRRDARG